MMWPYLTSIPSSGSWPTRFGLANVPQHPTHCKSTGSFAEPASGFGRAWYGSAVLALLCGNRTRDGINLHSCRATASRWEPARLARSTMTALLVGLREAFCRAVLLHRYHGSEQGGTASCRVRSNLPDAMKLPGLCPKGTLLVADPGPAGRRGGGG